MPGQIRTGDERNLWHVPAPQLMSCTDPNFWEKRYRANQTPWDQGGVPAATLDYLRRNGTKGSALIPGCGSGYEIQAFHDGGWEVCAIDFSAAAVERAGSALGPLADAVHCADFFSDDFGGPFDLVYERTFLCALPPERWPDYVRRMGVLVKPGGRLVGLFAYGDEPDPPPFLLPSFTAGTSLFAGVFSLAEDHAIPPDQSLPVFAAKERWQVWKRTVSPIVVKTPVARAEPTAAKSATRLTLGAKDAKRDRPGRK